MMKGGDTMTIPLIVLFCKWDEPNKQSIISNLRGKNGNRKAKGNGKRIYYTCTEIEY